MGETKIGLDDLAGIVRSAAFGRCIWKSEKLMSLAAMINLSVEDNCGIGKLWRETRVCL
jgi:hypothetical protein